MCQIEPSDGVMYSGLVVFYHRHGYLHTFLGAIPPLTILGIDEGGELDTVQYNQRSKLFTRAEVQEYQQLLNLLAYAVYQQDVQTIGRVATRSTHLNQKFNPKQTLSEVLTICQDGDALGVVTAHSGTSLGILLSPQEPSYTELAQELTDELGRVDILVAAVGSGGSLSGTARALRVNNPHLRIVAVDAVGSVIFGQPDHPHRLQGGLGNSLVPANVDFSLIDEIHWLNDQEAFIATRELARREKIFAGNSSGSVYAVAMNVPLTIRLCAVFFLVTGLAGLVRFGIRKPHV